MIKNYTSSVSAAKSIMHIEECLAANGASSIIKQYGLIDKKVIAISFFINIGDSVGFTPFRLPANVSAVEAILRRACKKPRKSFDDKVKQQAERTAWKILSDWVDAQMALIQMDQAKLIEVFMPYIWYERQGKSFFQMVESSGFSMLEAPKK